MNEMNNVDENTALAQAKTKIETVKDMVNYLIYGDLPFCDSEFFEDLSPIISASGKTNDINGRIKKKDAQSINAYHELFMGKIILDIAQRCGYRLEYEKPSPVNASLTPDWVMSSESEIVHIEVATKHVSNATLIKQAFIRLIAEGFDTVAINSTHFALPYFDKEKPDYDELQNHYIDLIVRIEKGIAKLTTDASNTICVDGLKITLGSSPNTSSTVGSSPSRYLLSIAEKAAKYKRLSEAYPLIIAIVSKNFIRGGTLPPKMMAGLLYGTIGKYHHEQFYICQCDYHKLEVMQPSIDKIAGILFCDMHNYNPDAWSYEYYPNPRYKSTSKIYNVLQTCFKEANLETR